MRAKADPVGKLGKNPLAKDVMGKTTENISKYPSVIEYLRKKVAPKNRPKPCQTPTAYKHGKIYFSQAKKMLRVYCRSYDRIEKQIRADPTEKDEFKGQWGLACACIEADTRVAEQ